MQSRGMRSLMWYSSCVLGGHCYYCCIISVVWKCLTFLCGGGVRRQKELRRYVTPASIAGLSSTRGVVQVMKCFGVARGSSCCHHGQVVAGKSAVVSRLQRQHCSEEKASIFSLLFFVAQLGKRESWLWIDWFCCAQYAINKEDGRDFYYDRWIINNWNADISQGERYETVDLELPCSTQRGCRYVAPQLEHC